jgi:hypothetical protein
MLLLLRTCTMCTQCQCEVVCVVAAVLDLQDVFQQLAERLQQRCTGCTTAWPVQRSIVRCVTQATIYTCVSMVGKGLCSAAGRPVLCFCCCIFEPTSLQTDGAHNVLWQELAADNLGCLGLTLTVHVVVQLVLLCLCCADQQRHVIV